MHFDPPINGSTPLDRWVQLKYEVYRNHNFTVYNNASLKKLLPLGLQYAYDVVEKEADYWLGLKTATLRQYLVTVSDVRRILLRETPYLARMSQVSVPQAAYESAAIDEAVARAREMHEHSTLTGSDMVEVPLPMQPDDNLDVSFAGPTPEQRLRLVKMGLMFRRKRRATFRFAETQVKLSLDWGIA